MVFIKVIYMGIYHYDLHMPIGKSDKGNNFPAG